MSYDFIYVICKVGHLFLFFCFFCYARSVCKEWKTTRTEWSKLSLKNEDNKDN